MESYDVIANQPVVIDNVSCVFFYPYRDLGAPLLRDCFPGFSLARRLFVTAWLGLSGGFGRRHFHPLFFPTSLDPRRGNRLAIVGWRTLGCRRRGRANNLSRVLGPVHGSRGLNCSVSAGRPPTAQFLQRLLADLAVGLPRWSRLQTSGWSQSSAVIGSRPCPSCSVPGGRG